MARMAIKCACVLGVICALYAWLRVVSAITLRCAQ